MKDLTTTIQDQLPRPNNIMLCKTCLFWTGTTHCKANYFIAIIPAWIPRCAGYIRKDKP